MKIRVQIPDLAGLGKAFRKAGELTDRIVAAICEVGMVR
jgi:hypothetical protein